MSGLRTRRSLARSWSSNGLEGSPAAVAAALGDISKSGAFAIARVWSGVETAVTPELVNDRELVCRYPVSALKGTSAYSPPPVPLDTYTQASESGVRTSPTASVTGLLALQRDCLVGSVPLEQAEMRSPRVPRTNAPRKRGASIRLLLAVGLTPDDPRVCLVNGYDGS